MPISKLTAVMFVVCFLALFGQSLGDRHQGEKKNEPAKDGSHHFVKRQADYDEVGADADGFDANYERSFERPRRIRVLPGFLH